MSLRMSTRRKPGLHLMAAALLLAWHPLLTALQEGRPAKPSIEIADVGGAQVDESRLVNLQSQAINVFGHARNCPQGELMAVVKSAGEMKWHLYGPVKAAPGGVFQIDEIRLPEPGDYVMIVALFAPGAHLDGTAISQTQLTQDALAISKSVNISITTPAHSLLSPEDSEYQAVPGLPGAAALEVLSVGNSTVRPNQSTVVEASGDVVVAARNLPPRAAV